MQTNNSFHLNKKVIFAIVIVFIVAIVAGLWYFAILKREIILKREAPGAFPKIILPQSETESVDEFLEFPQDVRPLLKNSLDEALEDIKALEL